MDPTPDPHRPTTPGRQAKYDVMHTRLLELIRKHHGSIGAMADEADMTRQGLSQHIHRHGLEGKCQEAKREHQVRGMRRSIGEADGDEAQLIRGALTRSGSITGAAKALGISRTTLLRRMDEYEISRT